MKNVKVICDECGKAEVKAGGFLLNKTELPDGAALMIAAAEDAYAPDAFDIHLCGKECLMRHLNGAVDGIKAPSVPKSDLRGKNPLYEVREKMRRAI